MSNINNTDIKTSLLSLKDSTNSTKIDTNLVDGMISVKQDRYYGYELTFPDGSQMWTAEIYSPYICGKSFHSLPITYSVTKTDYLGIIYVTLLALVTTAVITGSWPILIEISTKVDDLKETKETNDNENVEIITNPGIKIKLNDKFRILMTKKGKKCSLGKIWMMFSFICVLFFSLFLANGILVLCGQRNLFGTEKASKCYGIDNYESYADLNPKVSKLLNNYSYTSPLNKVSTQMTAVQNSDGSVTFTTNCGASFYNAQSNVVWTASDYYETNCTTREATIIIQYKPEHAKWCKGGSSARAKEYPWANGVYEKITEHKNWPNCFLATEYSQRKLSYEYKKDMSWKQCFITQSKLVMRRKDENGNIEEFTPKESLVVDPKASRAYGWYTNGTHEIIPGSEFSDGLGTSIGFGLDPNEMIEQAIMSDSFDDGFSVRKLLGVGTQPTNLQCQMMVTFSANDSTRWTEFAYPCKSVYAKVTNGRITIATGEKNWCNVQLVFNDGTEMTSSIKENSPVTVMGVKGWRCITTDNSIGIECNTSHKVEYFKGIEFEESINAIIPSGSSDISVFGDDPINLDLFSTSTLYYCIYIIAGLILIVIIVTIIITSIRYCKRKASERAKVMLVDANLANAEL